MLQSRNSFSSRSSTSNLLRGLNLKSSNRFERQDNTLFVNCKFHPDKKIDRVYFYHHLLQPICASCFLENQHIYDFNNTFDLELLVYKLKEKIDQSSGVAGENVYEYKSQFQRVSQEFEDLGQLLFSIALNIGEIHKKFNSKTFDANLFLAEELYEDLIESKSQETLQSDLSRLQEIILIQNNSEFELIKKERKSNLNNLNVYLNKMITWKQNLEKVLKNILKDSQALVQDDSKANQDIDELIKQNIKAQNKKRVVQSHQNIFSNMQQLNPTNSNIFQNSLQNTLNFNTLTNQSRISSITTNSNRPIVQQNLSQSLKNQAEQNFFKLQQNSSKASISNTVFMGNQKKTAEMRNNSTKGDLFVMKETPLEDEFSLYQQIKQKHQMTPQISSLSHKDSNDPSHKCDYIMTFIKDDEEKKRKQRIEMEKKEAEKLYRMGLEKFKKESAQQQLEQLKQRLKQTENQIDKIEGDRKNQKLQPPEFDLENYENQIDICLEKNHHEVEKKLIQIHENIKKNYGRTRDIELLRETAKELMRQSIEFENRLKMAFETKIQEEIFRQENLENQFKENRFSANELRIELLKKKKLLEDKINIYEKKRKQPLKLMNEDSKK